MESKENYLKFINVMEKSINNLWETLLKCEFDKNYEILKSIENMNDEFIKETNNYVNSKNEINCSKVHEYREHIIKLISQAEKYITDEDYISACDVLKYKILPELTKLSNSTR